MGGILTPNNIPTTEPTAIRAGLTLKWKRNDMVADYPSTVWALSYSLLSPAEKIGITATADVTTNGFNISETPITTASYPVGLYNWIAEATDGADVFEVGTGAIEVKADLSQVDTADGRSPAKKMVDGYEDLFAGRVTAATLDQQGYSIGGRTIQKASQAEIREDYFIWLEVYKREQAAEKSKAGVGINRSVKVRFAR